MQNKKLLLILFFFIARISMAQDTTAILNYINTYKDLAIEEMQRTGVPASIKLAQGIHETLAGTSDLVMKSNNHFGIKCKDTWTGPSVRHTDDRRNECFRKYNSAIDSYRDHSNFLKNSPRYASLFDLDPTDYRDWAYGLKKAGYATNPKYAEVIIKLIENYHLQDYTLIALGKLEPSGEMVATTTPVIEVQQEKENPQNTAVTRTEVASVTKDGFLNMEMQVGKEEDGKKEMKAAEKVIEQPTYPSGEFKINETRVIYAKKGTSFLSIAQQYNISMAWLYDFNDLKEMEAVDKDELIYLQRKRKTGNNEFHIVKAGETLHDIAQTEAIRLETLLEYNMLNNDMKPAVGEQLYLKTKAPSSPRLARK
jgi:LysM repeat protein